MYFIIGKVSMTMDISFGSWNTHQVEETCGIFS